MGTGDLYPGKTTDQLIIEQFPRVQKLAFQGQELAHYVRRMLFCWDRWRIATNDSANTTWGSTRWVVIWLQGFNYYRAKVEQTMKSL